jgi:poly [ADP-ribose] polymerase
MPKLIERVKLVCSSIEKNNNKVWIGELYDNGDVVTRWGRIRDPKGNIEDQLDSKSFPSAGESFLRKKEAEKLRPKKDKESYSRARTLEDVTIVPNAARNLSQNNLAAIAKEQLAKNHPHLSKLIDRLVQANIHNIVSQTSITYNSATGLFQTPLGVVTQDAIDEARNLLVEVKKSLIAKAKDLPELVSAYLRIIPHDVGVKLTVESIFPDLDSVQKESDILDSLEASYKAVMSQPKTVDDGKPAPVEKVFEVDLDILSDVQERKRLVDYFENSKKQMHGYGHIKVREIYQLNVMEMFKTFYTEGKKVGNIVEAYHGTSQANLLSILKSGLKVSPPSTAYIAGKMFGNGIYGAINSSKSLGYTFGRWGGSAADSGWLFVCDFAMGKVHRPSGTCSGPASGHDSVWAEAARCGLYHDELIIYKNHQVNIKYLLECK